MGGGEIGIKPLPQIFEVHVVTIAKEGRDDILHGPAERMG